jgi:replicative DNA helicase
VTGDGFQIPENVASLVAEAKGQPDRVKAKPTPDGFHAVSTREAIVEFVADAQRGDGGAIATGWPIIDAKRSGLGRMIRPGELAILAARTGVGKTWAVQHMIAEALQRDREHRAVLFPLEMTPGMMAGRILAHCFGVPPEAIDEMALSGQIQADEIVDRHAYLDRLAFVPNAVAVDDLEECMAAAGASMNGTPTIMAIDYLGLLQWRGQVRAPIYERASENATQLKAMTHDLGVVTLAAAQLSRSGGGAGDREPSLDAVRDSGVIEEAADRVIAFWRVKDSPQVQVKILKNRFGPTGAEATLEFDRAMRLKQGNRYELKEKGDAGGDDIPF